MAQRSGGQSRNGPGRQQQNDVRGEAQRAEQLLEEWGGRVGSFLAAAAVRAREEAEDIWAEAQSIRRGEHS